jgi:2-polyprenyl-3-methyl-5-hydroxy-6-metoxy-1,4-benzoquinol methylase
LSAAVANVEMHALKHRLRATWMAGDYDRFSRFMESSAVEFLDRVGIPPGASLLDVACGSGQLALVAARRGVRVTGVDIAENSIRAARERAQAEALPAQFDEGDAEALPYADASFDLVASLFGAMFAPRPDLVAQELVRVCRPGGTIAMANWTKTGFIGQMFAIVAAFIAPTGMPSPVLWGDESTVHVRLGSAVADLQMTRVMYQFDYPFSPAGVVDFFRDYYGPTNRAFAALTAQNQKALHEGLVALWSAQNQSSHANRTVVDSEYLQIVATRAPMMLSRQQ